MENSRAQPSYFKGYSNPKSIVNVVGGGIFGKKDSPQKMPSQCIAPLRDNVYASNRIAIVAGEVVKTPGFLPWQTFCKACLKLTNFS